MNYAKALRIVRAHRGLSIQEAAEKWCLVVNSHTQPSSVDYFAVMLETLETGLQPIDRQLQELAQAYKMENVGLFFLLAVDVNDLASGSAEVREVTASRVLTFIADPAP
jgi:hypothetical protein